MNNFIVRNLSEVNDNHFQQAVRVFVDSFFKYLKYLSSDKEKFIRVFSAFFVKEHFFVCLLDNRVVGIIAYSTSGRHCQNVDKKLLFKEFGRIKGYFLYSTLAKKPIPIAGNQAYIEDVATDEAARGKGVATRMMEHLMQTLQFEEYTLEVVDTNTSAIRVYEKLGFKTFLRKKQRLFRKMAGFNERLYMKKQL